MSSSAQTLDYDETSDDILIDLVNRTTFAWAGHCDSWVTERSEEEKLVQVISQPVQKQMVILERCKIMPLIVFESLVKQFKSFIKQTRIVL